MQISVVSHAVANILKRVLVVLLLYAFGKRVASINNFLGLAGCTIGLFVYVWDKTRDRETSSSKDGISFKPISVNLQKKICVIPLAITFFMVTLAVSNNEVPLFNKISQTDIQSSLFFRHKFEPSISNFKASNGHYESRSDNVTSSFFRGTFGHDGFMKPTEQELLPPKTLKLPQGVYNDLPSFLNRQLINAPENASFLAKELLYVDDIIRESQRLHFSILGDVLKKYKYAMLFDVAIYENKGDPCISVGEVYFLKRMNIEIVYYCNYFACSANNLDKAKIIASKYGPEQLVILASGGGNLIAYPGNDFIRFELLDRFPNYQMIVFPQSIWIPKSSDSHVKKAHHYYCCSSNLTLVLRDPRSFDIANRIFNGTTRLLMAPDMAFQIGRVQRIMSPVFDILWIKRRDGESPGYDTLSSVPNHLRVHISDWWEWHTPDAGGNSLEKAFYIATNGFFFLQRGRVVITDRLHGHILSTLMDIPHVLIDNKAKKLSSYHNTWTKSLHNTVITDDPAKALDLAIGLLEKFNSTLPPRAPYMDIIKEDSSPPDIGKPSIHYP